MGPTDRSQQARIAAFTRWGKTDTKAGTEPARAASPGSDAYWLKQTPTDLPHDERLRRAQRLKKAYFSTLALKSAKSGSSDLSGVDVGE